MTNNNVELTSTSGTRTKRGLPRWDSLDGQRWYHAPSYGIGPTFEFAEAAFAVPASERILDDVAVLEILRSNYVFGQRTLLRGLELNPWMSRSSRGEIELAHIPNHGAEIVSAAELAMRLRATALAELRDVVQQAKRVGILLSGGMDSRIAAGLLRIIQDEFGKSFDVVAITWGNEDARDVVYAREIASRYGWEFVPIRLSSEMLWRNIERCARFGCEMSPVHLHAVNEVAQIRGVDAVIAASYGDSIGRGEYSGRRIPRLPSLSAKNHDFLGLVSGNAHSALRAGIAYDIDHLRRRAGRRAEWQIRELEYQGHYMRRQLQPCISIITEWTPVHQLFTRRETAEVMWGVHPSCRTDAVYAEMLLSLPGNLMDVPWARTGRLYGDHAHERTPRDHYKRRADCYGYWLRNDLREAVLGEIESGPLENVTVLNRRLLRRLRRVWVRYDGPYADRIDERVAWLCSLSIFLREFSVKISEWNRDESARDRIRASLAPTLSALYRSMRSSLRD